MKTLYLECGMGASGDMIMSALFELIDKKEDFITKMNNLGLPSVRVKTYSLQTNGVPGTHISVRMSSLHDKQSDFYESHGYMTLDSINNIVSAMPISPWCRKKVMDIYTVLASATAETTSGGYSAQTVHFHNLGTLDSIADITGVCLLFEILAPENTVVSPVCIGIGKKDGYHGTSNTSHEVVKRILADVPTFEGDIESELCTRKGAAILKVFADSFGEIPDMRCIKQGCGVGKKNFGKPNCIRAFWGEGKSFADMSKMTASGETVVELKANIDDMTPEMLSYAEEILFEQGALEVYTIPIHMKKNRSAVMLCCMCETDKADYFAGLILQNTTTIGVRSELCKRYTMDWKIKKIHTKYGEVRVKHSKGYGAEKRKPEFEDVAKIAREKGISINEVYSDIIKEL